MSSGVQFCAAIVLGSLLAGCAGGGRQAGMSFAGARDNMYCKPYAPAAWGRDARVAVPYFRLVSKSEPELYEAALDPGLPRYERKAHALALQQRVNSTTGCRYVAIAVRSILAEEPRPFRNGMSRLHRVPPPLPPERGPGPNSDGDAGNLDTGSAAPSVRIIPPFTF
jgi:hypothetical protein